VLFMVTNQCAMYCRFCTRKRKVGRDHSITPATIQQGIDYIASHPEVRDVVISGGDPLFLKDEMIDSILSRLRAIPHLEIMRIGTRIPVVLPQRITPELCAILKKHHPLYINTHFNSPMECTEQAKKACWMLADAGIPLGNQAVLLKGVNDKVEVMKELNHKLLQMRVKPYYIYQADMIKGTQHFRTSVQTGIDIIKALRGHTSGMAVPTFVVDAPGGGGKIPISPDYVVSREGSNLVLRNFEGNEYVYPDVADDESNLVELPAAKVAGCGC
jgi:lysine 2,3-aminomutase